MKLDAHHHFWQYDPVEYSWISDALSKIRRDFLPEHLKQEIDATGIDGVISVQARQTLEETDWLLGMAEEHDFIQGVVGWVPLVDDNVGESLERYAEHPHLKAVRHVLQDEPDDAYMLGDDFNRGLAHLKDLNLTYDILIFERHLPHAISLVDRHPDQVFVLDHIAKPRIKENLLEPWGDNMKQLAERENVFCKISGMATEADVDNWTEEELQPYLEISLETFGPDRLLFGTDWPVCLVACEYVTWFDLAARFISRLTESEQAKIMGENATRAYRIAG
ncbi:MAG: amidohydrolase family protein [Verrucomicrobiota bacterium]